MILSGLSKTNSYNSDNKFKYSWTVPDETCPNLFQGSQDSLMDNLVHLDPKDWQGRMDPVVS